MYKRRMFVIKFAVKQLNFRNRLLGSASIITELSLKTAQNVFDVKPAKLTRNCAFELGKRHTFYDLRYLNDSESSVFPSLCTKEAFTNLCHIWQSAIFNFQSLVCVILLLICTCTYIRSIAPSLLDNRLGKVGFLGLFWKCARIGERKSPYVALSCLFMAFSILFWT